MSDGKIHSRYGGSIASRWLACPGSVALCDSVPPETESIYAQEGTHAHQIAEEMLRGGVRVCGGADVELNSAINVYLGAVWAVWDAEIKAWQTPEGGRGDPALRPVLLIEEDFVLPLNSAETGEVFGRNDAMIWAPLTGNLHTFDYKHGAGVAVEVENSKQQKFYTVGAVWKNKWKPRRIFLNVIQPRLEGAEPVKTWEMPAYELIEFFGELDDGVKRCKGAQAVREQVDPKAWAQTYLKTGDHCRWCPAAGAGCPAKEAEALEAAAGVFSSFVDVTAESLPKPEALDYERLGKLLHGLELIGDWSAQVRAFLYARLQDGEAVPGWKLVEKLGRRKWSSGEEEIAAYLGMAYGLDREHLRPRQLVTITEVKKLLKAALTDKKERQEAESDLEYRFTVKESSGLTMVPDSSDRQGVVVGAADFSSVEVDA